MSTPSNAHSNSKLNPEALAGLALIGAALLGMAVANSPLDAWYRSLLEVPFSIRLGEAGLTKPVLLWVNDGLMAVFFLLVALELKREVVEGNLSRMSQIVLPLVGALGGIVVPALIFLAFNSSDADASRGWAIPAATDIAFALGVLAMLGKRVPTSLKTFLLSLAVFDDLAAIIIIAAFYTEQIAWGAKGLALVAAIVLFVFNRAGVRRIAPYALVGIFLWVCVLKSGVHATLAGVVVGLAIPLRVEGAPERSPLRELEHALHPWVAFAIVPVFAFMNAGVSLSGIGEGILDPVALGIAGGLFFGKMGGVFASAGLLIKTGRAELPAGSSWASFFGVCILAGIGFTMSLFIGTLAYANQQAEFGMPLRVGVLGGSLLSAVVGVLVLVRAARTSAAASPAS